jgi:hypothetical protein
MKLKKVFAFAGFALFSKASLGLNLGDWYSGKDLAGRGCNFNVEDRATLFDVQIPKFYLGTYILISIIPRKLDTWYPSSRLLEHVYVGLTENWKLVQVERRILRVEGNQSQTIYRNECKDLRYKEASAFNVNQ